MTKTSHEFYIEFNGILLIGNGRIQHANYCCIISLIGKYLHGEGWDHCILFIFGSTFIRVYPSIFFPIKISICLCEE